MFLSAFGVRRRCRGHESQFDVAGRVEVLGQLLIPPDTHFTRNPFQGRQLALPHEA
jgi:hypothetical protein